MAQVGCSVEIKCACKSTFVDTPRAGETPKKARDVWPNIIGYLGNMLTEESNVSGAFRIESSWENNLRGDTSGHSEEGENLAFEANRSSSVFGASTTVQPAALQMLPCIKV